MAKEITDEMIMHAALRVYGVALWHEVENGGRYFGLGLYVDLILRCKELSGLPLTAT